jgi:hypothetical protein
MSTRLLSFLNDIEYSLRTGDAPVASDGLETARSVNYHSGLARLAVSARTDAKVHQTLGAVLLQTFSLADGSLCLKVFLSWTGTRSEVIHAIYARPGIDWKTEAHRVASLWLDGRARASDAVPAVESLAAAG